MRQQTFTVEPEHQGERLDQYLPLSMVRARLAERFTLTDIDYRTGGPARYVQAAETGGRVGFITPMTHNFCESCNRVRLTCTGTLFMCLGQEDAVDLRGPLRASEADELLHTAIEAAVSRKPKGHDFVIDRRHKRAEPNRTHSRATIDTNGPLVLMLTQWSPSWNVTSLRARTRWSARRRSSRRRASGSPMCSSPRSPARCGAS